jgi:hypothetical protein
MSTTAAVKESEVEQIDHVLGEEYEHMPVPAQARRSLFSVTMVWIGFPMIITGAMTGSVLVLGMGFQRALIAMIIGNLIMFAYVGALGALGTKKGMNFALIASIVFGRKGYVFSSGLLSTLLLGWYAVQTGITGTHQFDLPSELRADDHHRRVALHRHHVHRGEGPALYRPRVGAALRHPWRLGRRRFGCPSRLGGGDVLCGRRRQRCNVDGVLG